MTRHQKLNIYIVMWMALVSDADDENERENDFEQFEGNKPCLLYHLVVI